MQPPVGRNRPEGRVAEGSQRFGRPHRLRRHAERAETTERRQILVRITLPTTSKAVNRGKGEWGRYGLLAGRHGGGMILLAGRLQVLSAFATNRQARRLGRAGPSRRYRAE